MAKQTKEKKQEYADNFFKENPSVKKLFFNSKKEEWFTDVNWGENSIEKNEKGEKAYKLEVFENTTKEADQANAGQ
jgi:hypothetical protein